MTKLSELKKRLMQNPKFKDEYEKAREEEPCPGFFSGLTDAQKVAALAYRGSENHGGSEDE